MTPHQAAGLVRESSKRIDGTSIPESRALYLILAETNPPPGYENTDYILMKRVNERVNFERLRGRNVVVWTNRHATLTAPTLIAIALKFGAAGVACFNPKRYWKRDAA